MKYEHDPQDRDPVVNEAVTLLARLVERTFGIAA